MSSPFCLLRYLWINEASVSSVTDLLLLPWDLFRKSYRTTGTKPGYPAAVHTELSLCQHRDCVHKVCTYTLDYIIASHSMMNQWQDGKQWWFISLGTYAWSSKWRFKKYQNVGSITKDGIFQLFNLSLVDIMSVSFQVTKTHNQIYSVDSTGVSRL